MHGNHSNVSLLKKGSSKRRVGRMIMILMIYSSVWSKPLHLVGITYLVVRKRLQTRFDKVRGNFNLHGLDAGRRMYILKARCFED